MLIIQIKNWQDKCIATLNNIFSLQVNDEVNKWWKLKIKFPAEKRMQTTQLKKGYRIIVNYWIKIWKIIRLFDWYITDITLSTNWGEIQGENRLTYLQNRIIRSQKNYTNAMIKNVISEVFTELNNTYALPISLWLNDCETTITRRFDTGTSFYDILKYCRWAEKNLVVRIINWVLEISENTWNILEWVWEYDTDNTRRTNIINWEWKDTMDNYYTYIQNQNWSISNSEEIEELWLTFEKYEWEWALSLPTGIAVPSVDVSRDTDRRDFNIWDRKHIRLNTWYEWLPLEYLWLIQSRKVDITSNWWIKAEIKITENYKEETNILDLILTNLRKK